MLRLNGKLTICKHRYFYYFLLVYFSALHSTWAQVPQLDFDEIWERFKENSKPIQVQRASLVASEIESNRNQRHWYPTLHAEASSFYTNDPGKVLFSKLGERAMGGADFSPTNMNFPDESRHEKATLTARWMLFEGGSKMALAEYSEKNRSSMQYKELATQTAEYSKAIGFYGQLIIINRKIKALEPLSQLVDQTLARYQIGSAANPLGYSGALGLKNLKLRFQGELSMLKAQERSILKSLRTLSGTPASWRPKQESLTDFLKTKANLVDHGESSEFPISHSVAANRESAEAMKHLISAERAQFLPQVGVFAQQDFYNNIETNFSDSRTFGIFAHWQLFSAPSYGVISQVAAQRKAIELQAEYMKLQQKSDYEKNALAIDALIDEIRLSDESLKLLEEQSQVSRKLFNNGLITALQLTEVYNRRVDVINARTSMEENLLKLNAEMINYISFEIK